MKRFGTMIQNRSVKENKTTQLQQLQIRCAVTSTRSISLMNLTFISIFFPLQETSYIHAQPDACLRDKSKEMNSSLSISFLFEKQNSPYLQNLPAYCEKFIKVTGDCSEDPNPLKETIHLNYDGFHVCKSIE